MTQSRLPVIRRCALVGAPAGMLLHSPYRWCPAMATMYSPGTNGSNHISAPMDSSDRCSTAAVFSSSIGFTRKSGGRVGGSHRKWTHVTAKAVKLSNLDAGLKSRFHLMERSGASLPRLTKRLFATKCTCSSVRVFPMASISTATLTSSFSAVKQAVLALDLSVLRSSFGTSVNLVSLCSLVVWLQSSGQLPPDTPVVLSQVAFRLFIPCFLLSKVATTLKDSSAASNLVGLPLMAGVQVFIGAMLGKLMCNLFFKVPSLQHAVDVSRREAGDIPSAVPVNEEKQERVAHAVTKKQALITAACAFGNSLTLPLVFMSGVLSTTHDVNQAAGYLALFMVGWSPCMWTIGYKILTAGDEQPKSDPVREQSTWLSITKWIGNVMNPPLYGVLIGLLVGGTPLSHLFLGGNKGAALASSSVASRTGGYFAKFRVLTGGILSPIFEAVSLLGTATLAVQTVVLATSLGASLPKPGAVSPKVSHQETDPDRPPLSVEETEVEVLKSESVLDSKAFWAISLVRLILLPSSGLLLSFILQFYHLLPADPIYGLVILAESAMPTAQNLVLLAQLNAGTRPLAGMLAELLLRQYALSIISLTVWMAIFLKFTPIP